MTGCQSWGRRCNYAENRCLFVLVVWRVYRHFAVAQRTRLTSTLHRRPAPTWRLQTGSLCLTTPRTGCPNCSSRTPRHAWLSTTLWRIRGSVYVSPQTSRSSAEIHSRLKLGLLLLESFLPHVSILTRDIAIGFCPSVCLSRCVVCLNWTNPRVVRLFSPSVRPSFSFRFTQPSRRCKIPITPHQGR